MGGRKNMNLEREKIRVAVATRGALAAQGLGAAGAPVQRERLPKIFSF
jgi:hypothetical protein